MCLCADNVILQKENNYVEDYLKQPHKMHPDICNNMDITVRETRHTKMTNSIQYYSHEDSGKKEHIETE